MADVFVRRRRSQTRSRERHFGEIPLSTGEIEYLTRQDEATRRRQRLLQVREQEKRAAQLVTQRYRDNLRKLQSYKLQLAQRDHRHQQDTVLSALHEKYQYSLQGMGTAQRNAREKMMELMELAQLEQDKWSLNRRGEKHRFKDAVDAVHEDVSVRLSRRREIDRNLKKLKEMSLKHRSEASARAQRELAQELKLQKAQEDAQRYREYHLETEEFSFPRKTPKDVTAYQFTRTHCVAVPGAGNGSRTVEGSTVRAVREVKVIRHNRNTQQTVTSAIDQAEVYRKEMELKQETEWRMREQQARVAGSRGQDALHTVESIHEGTRALEWLVEMERQARDEKVAQLNEEAVKTELGREEVLKADDSGSEAFARMFGIEEGNEGLLDESFGARPAQPDSHPERIAARRAGSVSASDESWLFDDEWRTPSERFGSEELDATTVVRAPAERVIDQKIETMNELLKKIASYGETNPTDRDDGEAQRADALDVRDDRDATNHHRSRQRYEEWKGTQGQARNRDFDDDEVAESDEEIEKDSFTQRKDGGEMDNDDPVNRVPDPPQLDRHSMMRRGQQDGIDATSQQNRRSIRVASESFPNTPVSTQAGEVSGSGRLQGDAAGLPTSDSRSREDDDDDDPPTRGPWSKSVRASQHTVDNHRREQQPQSESNRVDEVRPMDVALPEREGRYSDYGGDRETASRARSVKLSRADQRNIHSRRSGVQSQSNWKDEAPTADGTLGREDRYGDSDTDREPAASGRGPSSSTADDWNASSRRNNDQSRSHRVDGVPSTDFTHHDREDQYGDDNIDSDYRSRDSDAESRQKSLDELEERLQQVLEKRRSSENDRTQRSSHDDRRSSVVDGQALPAWTDSNRRRVRATGGEDEQAEGAGAARRQSNTSATGESRRSVNGELVNRGDGNEESGDDAASDYSPVNANREGLLRSLTPSSARVDGDDSERDERDGQAVHEGAHNRGSRRGSGGARVHKNARHASTSPAPLRLQGFTDHRVQDSTKPMLPEGDNALFEDERDDVAVPDEDRGEISHDSSRTERKVLPRRSSRHVRPQHEGFVAQETNSVSGASGHEDAAHPFQGDVSAQSLDSGGNQHATYRRTSEGGQAGGPSDLVALDESGDASDFDSSMLLTEEVLQPGGVASYLRQMQQEGMALQSSSSSFAQYSLPLSDSFSSMNDSIIEVDGGVALLANQLLPMFPQQLRRTSDVSTTTDEVSVRQTNRLRGTQGGFERGETGILLKGLQQQDDEATAEAAGFVREDSASTRPVNARAEDTRARGARQEDARLPSRRRSPDKEQPRGPLHDLSFSSDSSSDMSAFIYLTRMRKVASMGTPEARTGGADCGRGAVAASSSESLSGLSSLSSTPVHPSMPRTASRQANQGALPRETRRDSVGSSTPSIDDRFQYLVNMTAVAGKALPLHMNLPPKDLSRGDMRFPPPQVKLNVYSSESDEDDGDSQTHEEHSDSHHHRHDDDQEPTTEAEPSKRGVSMQGRGNASGHTQYPLPAAPFGQFDLSNPPAPVFGSSSASSFASNNWARRSNSRSDRGSNHSDRSRSDDAPVQQFGLEELSQRMAGLPPPPFGNFDMSQPPNPLAWGYNAEDNDDASSAFGSERLVGTKDENELRDDTSQADARSGATPSASASPQKKGEAVFVPLETGAAEAPAGGGSLADLFRQRHPNFHRRAQEANQSLLEQRREQLTARRTEAITPASTSQLQQPSIRVKPKAPPSPARSRTPSTMSMPPPALLDRLSTGERAKISAQEMKDRTRRLYRQLPEVAEKKRQEEVLERRRQRLTEMREREKLRRQQQKQRQR